VRRASFIAMLACVVVLIPACGGDDDTTTSAPPATTTTTGPTGATGTGGAPGPASVDDVAACLRESGFDASPDDAQLVGIDAPYERLDVAQGELDEAAVIVVFESDADAEAQKSAVGAAAGVSDVKLAGNTVYGLDSAADFSPAEELVIRGCLPAG
jgi:hypothetical protein